MIVSRILCWSWAGLSLHPWREHIIQLSLRSLTTLSSSSSFHQHHHHDHYHHIIIIIIIIITRITVDQPHNLGGPSNPQQQSHLVCYSPRQHCPPLKLNLFVFSPNSIHFHLPIIVCLSVCLFVFWPNVNHFNLPFIANPLHSISALPALPLPKILSIKNKKSGFAKSSQTKFTKSMSTSNLQSSLHQKGGFLCFQSPAWSHSCPKEKRDFCRNLHGDSVAAGAKLVQQDVSFKSGKYGPKHTSR